MHIDISITKDPFDFFKPINLKLPQGHITCLVGESGAGKTTLLRMLAGLIPYQDENKTFTHEEVGYMTQSPVLLPWLTVLDNICLRYTLTRQGVSEHNKAYQLLKSAHLDHIALDYPHQLSLGMQQRICFIRVLLESKKILLLDEPFAALDTENRRLAHDLLVQNLLPNMTVLMVTHDWTDVHALAHSVYLIKGKPATVLPINVPLKPDPIPRNLDNLFYESCI